MRFTIDQEVIMTGGRCHNILDYIVPINEYKDTHIDWFSGDQTQLCYTAHGKSDEYQLIKVRALLERMSVHFKCEDFRIIEKVWILINSAESEIEQEEFEKAILDFFDNAEKLVYGFREFALDLRKNGDLCSNLMTFIKNKCIIVSNNRNLF